MEGQAFKTGEQCQRYEILRLIGSGGFGEVYQVADANGAIFALKILKLRFRLNMDLSDRFYREAGVLKAIEHLNVVRFIDAGLEERGMLWIVMEWLQGSVLRDYLHHKGGRLPIATAFRFARQICQGAGAAHAARVIHRDLKPDNIMVTPGDILKIFDFGLAKIQAWGVPTTQPGRTFGTPTYMAPEQCDGRGRKPDARTDVYAIGIILYEMLWGAHPFADIDGELPTQQEAITMQLSAGIAPLPERISGFPGYLWDVVARALEKEPDARWPSARDFSDAIGVTLKRYLRETRDTVLPIALPAPVQPTPLDAAAPAPPLPAPPPEALAALSSVRPPVVMTERLALPSMPVLPFASLPAAPAAPMAVQPPMVMTEEVSLPSRPVLPFLPPRAEAETMLDMSGGRASRPRNDRLRHTAATAGGVVLSSVAVLLAAWWAFAPLDEPAPTKAAAPPVASAVPSTQAAPTASARPAPMVSAHPSAARAATTPPRPHPQKTPPRLPAIIQ